MKLPLSSKEFNNIPFWKAIFYIIKYDLSDELYKDSLEEDIFSGTIKELWVQQYNETVKNDGWNTSPWYKKVIVVPLLLGVFVVGASFVKFIQYKTNSYRKKYPEDLL